MPLTMLVWGISVGVFAGPPQSKPDQYGYFDFPTCVRYALVHSERILRNRLEIQVGSADVKDAHAEILPSLELITRYYLATAGNNSDAGKINVQIYMSNFNPLLALFKIKSTGILVDMATTSHYDKIAEAESHIAKLFCAVHFLEKNIRTQRQIATLLQNKVDYGRTVDRQGTADPLELKAWANSLKGRQIDIRDLENQRQDRITKLKLLLGYHPDFELPLDTRDAVNQVLNGFTARNLSFAEVQATNLGLKIAAKKEQLQSTAVSGSYVAMLPRPSLVVEQIQNQVDRTTGFNFALGIDYTLWDGFKKARDIKRQKFKAEQAKLDRSMMAQQLYGDFKRLKDAVDVSAEREAFCREEAKLAELAEEKVFSQYKAGDVGYDLYLDRNIQKVEAQLRAIKAVQERVDALIDLATIAGGLDRHNVRIHY